MKWILLACLILALLPSAALAADCDNNGAVWSSEWKAKDGEPFWKLTFTLVVVPGHFFIRASALMPGQR